MTDQPESIVGDYLTDVTHFFRRTPTRDKFIRQDPYPTYKSGCGCYFDVKVENIRPRTPGRSVPCKSLGCKGKNTGVRDDDSGSGNVTRATEG